MATVIRKYKCKEGCDYHDPCTIVTVDTKMVPHQCPFISEVNRKKHTMIFTELE